MAFLKLVTGSTPGKVVELDGERTVFGRHPSCEVVLDNAAVSRHHAQILESHGSYFLEDLRSRNRTLLNGVPVEGRRELRNNDSIKVCDVVFDFFLKKSSTDSSTTNLPPLPGRESDEPDTVDKLADSHHETSTGDIFDEPLGPGEDGGTSSILSRRDAGATSSLWIGFNPEAKLKAVLEISKSLGSLLDVDDVAQGALDGLFKLFPQAQEGFVLLKDAARKKLMAKATKVRNGDDDTKVRISMTVVKQAMKTCEGLLSADAADDDRFDMSESVSALQIHSMMCAPLVTKKGKSMGVIQLSTNALKSQFSKDDLDMLVSVTSQVSLAVENANMHAELLQQRDTDRDLEFATQVQLGFLPNQRPKLEGYEFWDYYEAALSVGGDYFDYVELPDSRIAVALGDVAGKGIPAALLMARLYSAARFHMLTASSVAEALGGLNDEIASSALGHRFITYVIAVIDTTNNVLTVANAGHLPPLLRSANGRVRGLGQADSGMPLGIAAGQVFNETKVQLTPGDTLVLYTDGVTEAMNSENELYGSDGLEKYLPKAPHDAEGVVNGIIADVEQFCGGRSQRDDMCLVVAHRNA